MRASNVCPPHKPQWYAWVKIGERLDSAGKPAEYLMQQEKRCRQCDMLLGVRQKRVKASRRGQNGTAREDYIILAGVTLAVLALLIVALLVHYGAW